MEKSARRLFAFAGVIFLRREGAGRMGLREEAARLPAAADIARILAREGLRAQMEPDAPAPDGSRRDARTFSVTVWDLEAVDIARCGAGPLFRPAPPDAALARRIGRAAARALYALGLDGGQVRLDVDAGGRVTVRALSATPEPAAADGERRLADAIRRQARLREEERRRPPAAVLGADPEFVLLSPEGRIVPASRYFPPGAAIGSDSLVVSGVRRWPLAELRPAPAAEPAVLAGELRRLLAEAARRAGDEPLTWRAGALPVPGLPLGGHIHFSGVAPTPVRLRALDNAVALPLRLLEPPGASRRRPRYGVLGDFRRKAHGGFEYRTPPSWLVSPALACGVLALAKIAAETPERIARPLDDERVRAAFYADGEDEGARHALAGAVREVMRSVRQTEGYAKYGRLIAPLFRAIESGKTWNDAVDLRDRWRVRG